MSDLSSEIAAEFLREDDIMKASRNIQRIVRSAVIEECAKAAEGFPKNREWVPGSLYETLRRETAAAIRALKGDRDG